MNQKLKRRFEFVKEQIISKQQTNASSKGCQTNCIGCAGVN